MKNKKKPVKVKPATIYMKDWVYDDLKYIAEKKGQKISRFIADLLESLVTS